MARTEARIFTAIWRDADFVALTPGAQRVFLLLMSQADLAQDGVVALREPRWERMAAGVPSIAAELDELERARFVVVDRQAGELLVRTHMRHDRVYLQPNLLRAALSHLTLVTSVRIRIALAEECRRLLEMDDITAQAKVLVGRMLEAIGNPSETLPEGSEQGTRNPLGERGVVTVVTTGDPFPLDPLPLPLDPSSLADARSAARKPASRPARASREPAPDSITQRSKRITDAYTSAEPMSKWPAINTIVIRAIKAERWTDDEIQTGLLRMACEKRVVTVDSLRVELDGLPASNSVRGSPRLVEHNGLRLKPETVANMQGRARWEAEDQAAIEGRP